MSKALLVSILVPLLTGDAAAQGRGAAPSAASKVPSRGAERHLQDALGVDRVLTHNGVIASLAVSALDKLKGLFEADGAQAPTEADLRASLEGRAFLHHTGANTAWVVGLSGQQDPDVPNGGALFPGKSVYLSGPAHWSLAGDIGEPSFSGREATFTKKAADGDGAFRYRVRKAGDYLVMRLERQRAGGESVEIGFAYFFARK